MAFPVMAALALAQLGMAAYQTYKGSKAAEGLNRPQYEIPDEVKQKLSAAHLMALEGLPAAQKQEFVQNIQRGMNFGLRNLSDRKAGIAGLSSLVQSGDDAYNKMLVEDATQKLENQKYLGTVQSEMGGFRDKAYQLNELEPYMQKSQSAAAMKGAGMQNIYGALQSGINAYGQSKYLDFLKDINGVGNAAKTVSDATQITPNVGMDIAPTVETGIGTGTTINTDIPQFSKEGFNVNPQVGMAIPTISDLQQIQQIKASNPNLSGLSDQQIMNLIAQYKRG